MVVQAVQRRYDLDWLRGFAVFAIFALHHATRFFDTDDWFIKNATTYLPMQIWLEFCTSWGMPLVLIISGASAFLALEKTRPGKYVGGLFLRLLVPLIVGMFTHVAVHVYLENLQEGKFSGSFFAFYPHYFEGMYGFGGNFAWMGSHLWYLELLFIVSLIYLPMFLWFKRTAVGQRVLQGMGDLLANPFAAPLLALPAILLILNLNEADAGNTSLGGWSLFIYPLFYFAGFVILSNERLQKNIIWMRWIHLAMGLILSTAYLFVEFQTVVPSLFPVADPLGKTLDCFVVWSWLLAVLGFGMKHLNFTNPFLKYANEATLPFYIQHQTVVISLGFFVVQWAIPDLLKYVIILVVSFVAIMGLYEFGVRRFNLMRFLFGMKLLAKPVGLRSKETQFKEVARTM
ncbi:MAG: acyltransferase [Chloroflexi bacterium]|nr:acyltransferase [Chloroflexota bacterium]